MSSTRADTDSPRADSEVGGHAGPGSEPLEQRSHAEKQLSRGSPAGRLRYKARGHITMHAATDEAPMTPREMRHRGTFPNPRRPRPRARLVAAEPWFSEGVRAGSTVDRSVRDGAEPP